MIILDSVGAVQWINRAAEVILDLGEGNPVVGKKAAEVIEPEQAPNWSASMENAAKEKNEDILKFLLESLSEEIQKITANIV